MLIGMDQKNPWSMYQICGRDYASKMHLLLDYMETHWNIADPWYTEDFIQTWMQIQESCNGLLEYCLKSVKRN